VVKATEPLLERTICLEAAQDELCAVVENMQKNTPNECNDPALLDKLFNLINRKQVYFPEAAELLKVTRQRIHQLKAAIALDNRFVLIKSESYKNRSLIRLALKF
jgi:hypothetical protein